MTPPQPEMSSTLRGGPPGRAAPAIVFPWFPGGPALHGHGHLRLLHEPVVLAGAAVAAIGFSVYQFLTRPAVHEAPRKETFFSSISVAPVAGGGVLSLGGSF